MAHGLIEKEATTNHEQHIKKQRCELITGYHKTLSNEKNLNCSIL